MCGIAGFFSTKPLRSEDQGVLDRMLKAIHHRGPDGRGVHFDAAQGVAMGHARLSIIDLETGHQPLFGQDTVLTVNGEFYDFKRARSSFMAQGDRFSCKSDSEIALSLYRRHGLDFINHLRGEFAFALYDRKRDELILVRDRFGIRPLFYAEYNGTLVYGSEVKAVLEHPDVPRRFDSQAILNQLMHVMVPGTSTFAGVKAVLPGHCLIVKRKGGSLSIRQRRYWDLDFPTMEQRTVGPQLTPEEHIEAVREQLIEAVVHRLEADVPVGCYLSGGVDSCSILGLAAGAMQSPVKAFTISFDHDDYDESSIAREMAQSMNADQEVIHLKAADLYGDNYCKTVWHAERTFYNTLGVAKFLMSRRVHECGYKTVITGEGADELFGGYPAFKRDMFEHGLDGVEPALRAEYQAALEKSNSLFKGAILAETAAKHPAFEKLCGFTPSWIQPWMRTLEEARPLLHPDRRKELEQYDPIAAIAETIDPAMLDGRHPLDKAQYSWSKTQLEGQILNWGGDRVDMANSMESRPAFLDHNLASVAVAVPPELRIRGNIEKWVLREAMKGVLPEVLYKREKFAFMAPPAHTDTDKQSKVGELIDQFLSKSAVESAGLLDPKAIDAFLTSYRADTDPVSLTRRDALLNHLLCIQILDRQYVNH